MTSLFRSVSTVALGIFSAALLPLAAQTPSGLTQVIMSPPGQDKGACFRELFEHPDDWAQTRAQVGGLLYADHNLATFSDADLTKWLAQMKQWNLKLELEVGGVKGWGKTGEGTFKGERSHWDRVVRLGGTVDSVAMDEPLCAVRFGMKGTDDFAVDETAKFIAIVRQNFPQTLVGDIEPYPSLPVEDQIKWIDALQKKLGEMNVKPLDFYRIDPDWNAYNIAGKGSWKDLQRLQKYCKSVNLPFSLIYWASDSPFLTRFNLADDSTWYVGIMGEGYAYAAINGVPDQYVIESWIDSPSHSTPETADFTFTRSVKDFTTKFVKKNP